MPWLPNAFSPASIAKVEARKAQKAAIERHSPGWAAQRKQWAAEHEAREKQCEHDEFVRRVATGDARPSKETIAEYGRNFPAKEK